ncbi:MAG: bifunctional phosphoribosylaminoimidazolecarboxamide formyltransferase/IMP cyclohydrolase [Candidatus Raymondbacteria bacterium RifOxyA12_full_50_37]|uniref:Bifunctional purine biosynthesis protein PurH n=1 Tax=Candidatus Raymondbacteria bacterium RIFOXYD12_FULL_49_13 TaxID=1817890 RepID=A0A1F7F572_UNCRA|nr:MAG: bifunctional phosphoribosylaminoimidazolecarboxamide formyltransferase/IMP cyclohydrolase [Candidatus Raymondbacteria bacterium RIFOXYA2_FULL_49_16]OGJ90125.1 MAG: bifunctional phosphoribosylaminoimidazolecarboxamide formyltransferase/IMP cyclohydrolase [Candidatus Raymondbacteria bacterium RifOxyA12_full_50_37]OGJ92128.1 MAG: bifunctional phosphoribosylaminoimidazolecarboxamide formyltransferase/IMP cyclohydrolase [Candidatus Raymondbacteria bacterium RifOxyB12_full_50_8]OGJ97703.1 MAG:
MAAADAKKPTRRVLISVSDKTHIVDMAKCLTGLGFEVVSTGGTAKELQAQGVPVTPVSVITGFPEIMDGRVKTLHPKIHGGLLGVRENAKHCKEAVENSIQWIEMVIINLYPFQKTVAKENVTIEEAIENIDIGGPSMIRSAAKNYKYVTVVVDPADYKRILEEINIKGETSLATREKLAVKAFALTAAYDAAIDTYLCAHLTKSKKLHLQFNDGQVMRYGENPHQTATFYKAKNPEPNLANAKQLHGKELSFNNIVDGDAALEAVKEITNAPAAVVIKHTNPCGFATAATLEEALECAWNGDQVSSFGSVIAVNQIVDIRTANRLQGRFVEMLIAPDFNPDALEFLRQKSKDIRLLKVGELDPNAVRKGMVYRHVTGGMLEQERDSTVFEKFDTMTTTPFPEEKQRLAQFTYAACKHVKSNAIVLGYEYKPGFYMVLGMGAGQPNRVDSIRKLCMTKAAENTEALYLKQKPAVSKEEFTKEIFSGCVLASDAFFPFDDNIHQAASFGIKYIVQPGGSKRDDEVIATCNKYSIAMIFTGMRHFRH